MRSVLKNDLVRIILRTGQPGLALEEEVIVKYDINDYKTKTELTRQKLFTTIITALRAYRDLCLIEASRQKVVAYSTELEQTERALIVRHELLERDLRLACKIQSSLLPPAQFKYGHLDVACYTQPAQEVGGDFYVYHQWPPATTPPNFHLGIAVGDVSGKGMPAALLMTLCLAFFRSLTATKRSAVNMLTGLDK